jgi:hypothetical protein
LNDACLTKSPGPRTGGGIRGGGSDWLPRHARR